jgi:hypothetical protein
MRQVAESKGKKDLCSGGDRDGGGHFPDRGLGHFGINGQREDAFSPRAQRRAVKGREIGSQ